MRLLGSLLLAGAILLAGCGDGEELGAEAQQVADEFVLLLVSEGDPARAEEHTTGAAKEGLLLWHTYLLRDGVQTVEGPGGARGNCVKPFPVGAPREEADCLIYRLLGRTPIPETTDTLVVTARFRVWLTEEAGTWKVTEFDYTPQLERQ